MHLERDAFILNQRSGFLKSTGSGSVSASIPSNRHNLCGAVQASIVVMLLACIVGTGALLTAGFGGRNAVHDLTMHDHIGFASFCQR